MNTDAMIAEQFQNFWWEWDSQVNPVRNSNGALNPAGIILGLNPAAKQRGIISNGVNLYHANSAEALNWKR